MSCSPIRSYLKNAKLSDPASGLNYYDKRIQGFKGSRVQVILTRQKTGGNKQISNFEQKMLN